MVIRCFCHTGGNRVRFLKARWDTYSEDTILLSARNRVAHNQYRHGPVRSVARSLSLFRLCLLHNHRSSTLHASVFARVDRLSDRRELRATRLITLRIRECDLAHRVLHGPRVRVSSFGSNVWGITASDSAKGYLAWVTARSCNRRHSCPSAAGGSLMFTPNFH
jgi:hypothetical protein